MSHKIKQIIEDNDLLMMLAEMDLYTERMEKGEKEINKQMRKIAEPIIDDLKIINAKRSKIKNAFFLKITEMYEIDDEKPLKYIKEGRDYFIVDQTKEDMVPDQIKFIRRIFRKFIDMGGMENVNPDELFDEGNSDKGYDDDELDIDDNEEIIN